MWPSKRRQIDFTQSPVGQKIAIVTSKPQTTRNRSGIVNRPEGQIVFIEHLVSRSKDGSEQTNAAGD